MTAIRVIDSHTAGEPTRVIVDGGPDLGNGSMAERAARLAAEHRAFCASVLCEPRGHDAMVGALLVSPPNESFVTGVIFFNTVGNLGMCGHATIGTAVTLSHLGMMKAGKHRFDTPVGPISVEVLDAHTVSVENVESFRWEKSVTLAVEGWGDVTSDIAWGGNWFFLVGNSPVAVTAKDQRALTDLGTGIRQTLDALGFTGQGGARIDHIELFGPAEIDGANSKCFTLTPSDAYDRSPCGTGCSAKLAYLAAEGVWAPDDVWTQESIIGSTYQVSYRPARNGAALPRVTGRAFVTGETALLFSGADPYRHGIQL